MSDANQNRGGLLNIRFADKEALYLAYMPFISNGGVFIQTNNLYKIGDELFLVMSLPEDNNEKTPAACRVVWVTPREAQNNKMPGVGVQFRDKGVARAKIENILAGALKSELPTHTM